MGPGRKACSSGACFTIAVVLTAMVWPALPAAQGQVFAIDDPAGATQPAAVPRFARYVPIWSAAYLEVKDLNTVIDQTLAMPDEWGAMPGAAKDKAAGLMSWFSHAGSAVKRSLGISGRELVRDFLGDHFAVVWGGPRLADQFALICRPASPERIDRFLAASKAVAIDAKPTEPVRRYRLSSKLHVAIFDDLLILATVGRTGDTGMYYAMLDLIARRGEKSLVDHATFQKIWRQIDPDYESFLVLIPDHPPLDPGRLSPTDALVLRGLERLTYLAATTRTRAGRIHVTMFLQPKQIEAGFWPQQPLQLDPTLARLITAEHIALAYATVIEPAKWYHAVHSLADDADATSKHYRTMLEILLPDADLREAFLEAIGPELLFLLRAGPATVASTGPTTQPAEGTSPPSALAMFVRLKNPAAAQQTVAQISAMLSGFAHLNALKAPSREQLASGTSTYGGLTVHRISINPIAGGQIWLSLFPITTTGEIVWAIADDYLLVATDYDWLTELIDLLHIPTDTPATPDAMMVDARDAGWLLTVNLPRLGLYLEQLPALAARSVKGFSESRSDGRFHVVLGAGIQTRHHPQTGKPSVLVAVVYRDYPAWGKLHVGDVIVGIDNVILTGDDPHEQLRGLITQKATQRRLRVTVNRQGIMRQVVIDLRPRAAAAKTVKAIGRLAVLAAERYGRFTLAGRYSPTGDVRIDGTLQPQQARTTTQESE